MREKGFMSEQVVKAIYYPTVYLTLDETRFGSKRLRQPANPYVEPLKNKKILVKIDLLEGLKEVWGESILIARDNIYKIVSGDVDDDTYHKLVCTYYRTHSSFANFIDYCYMSRSQEEPFIKKFVEETRAVVRNYGLLVEDLVMNKYGGNKFLLEDHEYRYYAVHPICDLTKLKGVDYIQ